MNKKDFVLIFIVLFISLIFIIYYKIQEPANIAYVYYNNDIVLTIDLNVDNRYSVIGDNGNVNIEVKDKKIRVIEENSPYHLCSKQGFISKKGESIICLPNKIIIKLPDGDIDTEVG